MNIFLFSEFWRYHYTTNFEVDGDVLGGLYKCIEHMVPDSKTQDQIHKKLLNFSESIGTFGISMAIRNKAKNPLWKFCNVESYCSYLLYFLYCILKYNYLAFHYVK